MRTLARFASLFLVTALLIVPAAEAQHRRVYVRVGPPAPVVEKVVVSPHRGWVWEPGYYTWNHNKYTWTAGMWVKPPYSHARWNRGRWIKTRRGWYWQAGHWTRVRR